MICHLCYFMMLIAGYSELLEIVRGDSKVRSIKFPEAWGLSANLWSCYMIFVLFSSCVWYWLHSEEPSSITSQHVPPSRWSDCYYILSTIAMWQRSKNNFVMTITIGERKGQAQRGCHGDKRRQGSHSISGHPPFFSNNDTSLLFS